MKKIITFSVSAALLFSGCSMYVGFDAQQPSAIDIPVQMKKILLVNRTLPGKLNAYNQLEQMFTGDWAKDGGRTAFSCLDGLSKTLTSSLRNYEVKILRYRSAKHRHT